MVKTVVLDDNEVEYLKELIKTYPANSGENEDPFTPSEKDQEFQKELLAKLDEGEKLVPDVSTVMERMVYVLSGAIPEEIQERMTSIIIVADSGPEGDIEVCGNVPGIDDVPDVIKFLSNLDVSDTQIH